MRVRFSNPPVRLILAFVSIVLLLLAQGALSIQNQRVLLREVRVLHRTHDETTRILGLLHQVQTEVTLAVGTTHPDAMDRHRNAYAKAMATLQPLHEAHGLDPLPLVRLRAAYDQTLAFQYQLALVMARSRLAETAPLHEEVLAAVSRHLAAVQAEKEQALRRAALGSQLSVLVLAALALGTSLLWARHLLRLFIDRKKAEESIGAALGRLQSVLDAATQVAIIMTDPWGTIRLFNRGAEAILGYRADEVVDRDTPLRFHDPSEIETRRRELEAAGTQVDTDFQVFVHLAREGRPERRVWTYLRSDGGRRTVELTVTRVNNPAGHLTGFLGVAVDITQQMEAERALRLRDEQLRQSQKMDAIGQLAGGVAHDFNNMLGGILGAAELLAEPVVSDDQRQRLAHLIATASHRASDLTHKLLAFSRKGKLISTPVDLHRIVEDTVELLRRSIDRRIELEVNLRAHSRYVVGDPSQLQSALLNVAINSRDAMPDGGRLRITTEDCGLDEVFCQDSAFALQPGPFLRLSVQDTGTGIPREILEHIFEPFFTTKSTGKGTGLGLAAVYGTVTAHHGLVTVDSTPGEGSTFHLYFPATDPPETHEPSPEGAGRVAQARGTILVVDDEPILRETLALLLGSLGYEVLQAPEGLEGLRLFEANLGRIDLVILDMVMPGLTGSEVFQRLRALDPQARVVISSGFAKDSSIATLQAQGLAGFLGKPYRRRDLMEVLESTLGRP